MTSRKSPEHDKSAKLASSERAARSSKSRPKSTSKAGSSVKGASAPPKSTTGKSTKSDNSSGPALIDNVANVEQWNFEDAIDLESTIRERDPASLVVFSRDWTVRTIVEQIEQGNIDLAPEFQRRNAWQDDRRSRLIESFILNFPVPQIVLAENPKKKKAFIVIDGKQRLLTLAGFYLEKYRDYWDKAAFQKLKLRKSLNGITAEEFLKKDIYEEDRRQLANGDIRATVITDFKEESLLYDIFYRLNTGSVPLSSQELRQVIHRGDFSKFLVEETNKPNSLRKILNLTEADPRFRDVELLLRMIALVRFSSSYKGNLKPFLDESLDRLNKEWSTQGPAIQALVTDILAATQAAYRIFGERSARKYKQGKYETTINRAVFEIQTYYLINSKTRALALKKAKLLPEGYKELCVRDSEFVGSLESTTNSIENYRKRFDTYREMLQNLLETAIPRFEISTDHDRSK